MTTVPQSSLLTIFADETHMLPAQICADVQAIAASGKGCPVLLASLRDSLERLCRAMEGMFKAAADSVEALVRAVRLSSRCRRHGRRIGRPGGWPARPQPGYGADRPARSHGAPVSRTGLNPNCLI